jgi:hypothetical protein
VCDPIMIIGAVSSIVSYQQQVESAKQQQEYQNAVARARNEEINANNIAANAAAIDSYTQLNQKQAEEQQTASQENLDLNAEKLGALGTLAASNMNTGLSFDALKLDYERQADRYEGVKDASLKSIGLQTEAEKLQTHATAQNRMNSIQGYIQQPVATPTPWSLAIGLGGAYAYSQLGQNKPTFGKKTSGTSTYGRNSDWHDAGNNRSVYNY